MLTIFQEIHSFGVQNSSEAQNFNGEHKRILQNIVRLCDDFRRELGPTVSYLNSKNAKQLETRVNTTIDAAVNGAAEKFNTEADRLQRHSDQAEQSEAKRQEDFNQLKGQLEDTLAEESVSKYEKIFEGQASKHQEGAF